MKNWLIRNAELVNEGNRRVADVRLRDGRIETIAAELGARSDETVLDAAGHWLLPGMIDDQVHFREPGLEHKADFATESRAAVAGGITSYMEMPNSKPTTTTLEALEDKYARAAAKSAANHAFYLGATNDNLEVIRALDPRAACGIKIFMGASTGNMLVDDPATLDAIFRDAPTIVVTHCEDTPTIEANLAKERERYGDAIPVERHPYIRSREACLKSSTLAVELARRHGTRLHILHVTTADELALFASGPLRGKRITAETCVHFLQFSERDYPRLGNWMKCNPAIKSESDRLAIVAALRDGRIDVLATDHAPHTLAEKALPYEQAPSGLPLVQFALQCALEQAFDGTIPLERIVESLTHAPAELFQVKQRGYLREGYFADLVLVDPRRAHTVRREEVLSRCGWSPFEGHTFRSSIAATWVNGQRVWDGQRVDDTVRGMRLEFDR
ncbi:MAG: dihydroorotase [Lysobacterales bacterium 69-70]|nr:dihydroorotase [Xanthomonadaceae bacterium]ODU34795.1 MAG: dihydroorotase [Xanthomonadaceae bacterium SCN 69-320]ODV19689.1 MAG: dihydroorotase [Xanthomonadaceae bacterium SCN 69-25]OJY95048.1 MAG: dihydroorotase [Xanthomonadales bacterium 69-70]